MKTIPAWFLVTTVLLSFAAPRVAAGPLYTTLVSFGDSMNDMGNAAPLPENLPFPSKYPFQTWVKQLAGPAMLDIPGFKPSGNATFTGGFNFAYGGATTQNAADLGLRVNPETGRRHLTDQIDTRYLGTFNTAGVQTDAKTLHVVFIGLNDLYLAYVGKAQTSAQWSGMNEIAVNSARSVEGQIQALASAGVKNVLWCNLPDMSKFPAFSNKKGRALDALVASIKAFNQEMDAALARLAKAHPGLTLIKIDVARLFDDAIAHPSAYGLTNVTDPGFLDGYLFLVDGVHPTPHGHHILARHVFDVLKSSSR